MTILAWNCRGLGSAPVVRSLTDKVKESDPILVFLAKTKANQNKIKGLQRKLKLTQGITVSCNGWSGGLAMLWKEGVDACFKSYLKTYIDVVVCEGNGAQSWWATRFYRHPNASMRHISWNLLESLKRQCNMPWVVFGDFNEIINSDEKLGWLEMDARQIEGFRECLFACGLIDIGFVGQWFTWSNGRIGEQRTLVRLDRMVANEEWLNLFPEAKVFHKAMVASNHCLLSLSLRKRGPRRVVKKIFMFEEMWTREEGCRKVIEKAWDSLNYNPGLPIQERLKSCEVHLQTWNHKVFGNVNKILKQTPSRLQQLESMNLLHESTEEIQALKKEINEVMLMEEMMWNQKSRALWIKCGARNTKFFHAAANNRHRKNRIEGMCDSEGRWRGGREEVEDIILKYFAEICSTNFPVDFKASLGAMGSRVSEAMNEDLLREFREKEVCRALMQMHPTKSPGLDGMPPIFYQRYWNVVGPQVVKCVLHILRIGIMPNEFHYTYIFLIPKVKCPQKITEYRPISLCNVIYKIISKVLANKLKGVLPEVICDAQSTFVPGRQITNNVLVDFEIMHCINQRRKGKKGQMVIKLGMARRMTM